MGCVHEWRGRRTAVMHELVCVQCGRLGAVVSRQVAEEMEHDETFRARVWHELLTSEAPGSFSVDIRQRGSSPGVSAAPVSAAPSAPRSGTPARVPGEVDLSWRETDSFARFQETSWRTVPYAESQTARGCLPLLTDGTIAGLLGAGSALDVLVVRDGVLLSGQQPRSSVELTDLLRQGCSLVVRHAEAHDGGLAALAHQVASRLDGEVIIQLYMTPVSRHSFGWHYDAEEVIIIQTEGTKEYLFRRNTINPNPTLDAMPGDMEYERETSSIQSCTLEAGDWLYIPSGWWHVAHARTNSLSISVGITPLAAA